MKDMALKKDRRKAAFKEAVPVCLNLDDRLQLGDVDAETLRDPIQPRRERPAPKLRIVGSGSAANDGACSTDGGVAADGSGAGAGWALG